MQIYSAEPQLARPAEAKSIAADERL